MPDAAVANAAADMRYGSTLSAIQRKIAELNAQTQSNLSGLNTYGTAGRQGIGQAYDVLDTKLGENRTNAARDLGVQGDIIGRGYREANDVANVAKQEAQDYMTQLANGMGVDAAQLAGAQQNSNTQSRVADIIGNNAGRDATATGNLRNWAGQMDSVFAQGQGIGQRMRADASGRFESDLLNAISQAQLEGTKGQNQLNGTLLDTMAERGNFLTTEYNRLQEQEWQRALQQAQMDQQAQQANAELSLRAQALQSENSDRAYRQGRDGKTDQQTAIENQMKRDAMNRAAFESDRDFNQVAGEDTSEQWRLASALLEGVPRDITTGTPSMEGIMDILRQVELMGEPTFSPQQLGSGNRLGGGAMNQLQSAFVQDGQFRNYQKKDKPGFWQNFGSILA